MNFRRKVGDNINIDKMINMLLLKLSKTHDIFFMEKRNYRDENKRNLLMYLSKN